MWTNAIQVEIVGKPWWDDPLSIAAIVISAASFFYTWRSRRTDKAKLEVTATSITTNKGQSQENINVRATNKGFAGSAVVDGVHFKIGRKLFASPRCIDKSHTLPATLLPEDSLSYAVSSQELAQKLVATKRKPRHAVPIVTTGRRNYRGKWNKAGMDTLTANYDKAKATADKTKTATGGWWAGVRKP